MCAWDSVHGDVPSIRCPRTSLKIENRVITKPVGAGLTQKLIDLTQKASLKNVWSPEYINFDPPNSSRYRMMDHLMQVRTYQFNKK